jgi:hypothetical protein
MAGIVTTAGQDPSEPVSAAFEFLVTDFGFAASNVRHERSGFELRYQKNGVGVLVDWRPRDPFSAWLVRLVDDTFPPRGQTLIRADSTLYYFDLGHLVSYRGGAAEWADAYVPNPENAAVLARALVEYGRPLLEGDVALFDALQEYVKERARQVTIAHYGEDYARTLGW